MIPDPNLSYEQSERELSRAVEECYKYVYDPWATTVLHYPTAYYLARGVEELVHVQSYLVKQNGEYGRVEFVPDQLLDVFLYVCAEAFVVTDEELQQVADKPG